MSLDEQEFLASCPLDSGGKKQVLFSRVEEGQYECSACKGVFDLDMINQHNATAYAVYVKMKQRRKNG